MMTQSRKILLVLIINVLVIISCWCFVPVITAKNYADTIRSYGVIQASDTNAHIFRGVTVQAHQAGGYFSGSYSEEDYQRFKRWGMNAILYHAWWGQLEQEESNPYVYNEAYLNRLEIQMNLARQYGLYPFLAVRTTYGTPVHVGQGHRGWPNYYSYDYVNFNLLDATGIGGRDRFIALWEMLASRYPDTGMCVSFFPYHRESGVDEATRRSLYEETLPALYHAVRAISDEYIIVHPRSQGQSGDWNTGLTTGEYSFVEDYGWPFTNDPKLLYGFNNHGKASNADVATGGSWDYDYQRVADHYGPLETFKAKYNVDFICCESFSMDIHSSAPERPIDQSRLDWMRAHLDKMQEVNLGWLYFHYENPPSWASPMERDGSDTAVATLLSEYT